MSAPLAALVLALLAAPAAADNPDAQECPEGTVRVATNRLYEPFKCVRKMDPGSPFINMKPTFKMRQCPKGSHPVETPGLGGAKRYRCVMDGPGDTPDPEAEPVSLPGAAPRAVRSRGPIDSVGSVPSQAPAPAQVYEPPRDLNRTPTDYTRYTVRGQFQVDFPKGWHVQDAWQDEVPTFYCEFDTGRQGKQLQLVITRIAKGQEAWVDLPTAVSRDKEWQNAAEGRPSKVGGFPARETYVAKSFRTTYVAHDDFSYYTLSYSAPEDLYSVYEPAYRRMLQSFRLSKKGI